MDFRAVFFEDDMFGVYPAIAADFDLSVVYFNDAAKIMFPAIEKGTCVDDLFQVIDCENIRAQIYPTPIVIKSGNTAYLSALCPVKRGFEKYITFIIPSLGGRPDDNAAVYIASKLAVLSKCSSAAESLRHKYVAQADIADIQGHCEALCRRLEHCRGEVALLNDICEETYINGREGISLEYIFDYYKHIRYGASEKHYSYNRDEGDFILSPTLCVVITGMFSFMMRASSNAFVDINIDSSDSTYTVTMTVMARKRYAPHYDDLCDEMLYSVFGFDASDIVFMKRLAALNGWRTEMKYYAEDNCIRLELSVPSGSVNIRLKAASERASVDFLLMSLENLYFDYLPEDM